jgi:undecaprenyl-phosphate 4-deoxy-4-formamido-L-arabinose transferase
MIQEPSIESSLAGASVSVVVPVYNSESTIEELCTRLIATFEACGLGFEIILVNDGSRDGSWERIRQCAEKFEHIRGFDFMRNYGQHNALLCGIRMANHDITVTLDDDLQNPPEEIPTLLGHLTSDIDVVYGRPDVEQHGLWRDMASRLTKVALQRGMGAETAGHISAFRVFRTRLREAFADYRGSFVSIDVLLTWSTTHFKAIRVRHLPRQVGESNYTVRQLTTHALNTITGFSTLPLRIASLVGFSFTLFGVAVLLFVLLRVVLEGTPVPGFAFLASIIAIFSGAQLFSIGVIGEYLARMHFRAMDRPPYVIQGQAESLVESVKSG